MSTGTMPSHANRSFGQSSRASTSSQPYDQPSPGTQRFVIGKIDAGIAVLISDSVHLIEFPSLLLPSGVGPGSIVNIACTRNFQAERQQAKEFWDLQREISDVFGKREPQPPKLSVRNTTQTSVTLEWDKLDLASASLLSLSIYRNNQRLTTIPNPLSNTSTKLSGLSLDTDYTFHLVLKTTAGTYTSPVVKTRTHTIDNTSGISICFGKVEPQDLLEEAKEAVKNMGAKWDDKIQIDTTHFVATTSQGVTGTAGVEYQKAIQLSIPVVSPEWILSCHRSSKMVPISAFYLGQTNHAASLSSAQLVNPNPPTTTTTNPSRNSTSQQPPSRQVSTTTAVPPTTETVQEEPEQEGEPSSSTSNIKKEEEEKEEEKREEEEEVSSRPTMSLEEDVEQPPMDQIDVTSTSDSNVSPPQDSNEVGEVEKDGKEEEGEETEGGSSMKGVKSEVEEEESAQEQSEEQAETKRDVDEAIDQVRQSDGDEVVDVEEVVEPETKVDEKVDETEEKVEDEGEKVSIPTIEVEAPPRQSIDDAEESTSNKEEESSTLAKGLVDLDLDDDSDKHDVEEKGEDVKAVNSGDRADVEEGEDDNEEGNASLVDIKL